MNALFTTENTSGYTKQQLDALNAEWTEIVESEGLEEYTEEYDEAASRFSDEVAKR